ncbi:MAG: carboxy terminal-processing peptidase [Bacteroidetes bacterium]|nr:carboxy terminal-processing peptidase [Bacteroidota bacterium]
MHILKKNFKLLLLAVFVAVASCSFTTKDFNDPDREKLLLNLVTYVLERGHYEPRPIDDSFSQDVHDAFIKNLDPLKRFFLASDIKEFNAYKTEIDDQIKQKDLTFFNLVYERFVQRMNEVREIYPQILAKPFDYTVSEKINTDYDSLEYVADKAALKERWRLQLKFSALGTYYDAIETQESLDKKEAESEDTKEKSEKKSLAEIEADARETTKKSLDEYFDFSADLVRKDYFALYLNTIMEAFDPHTNYFAPPDKDRFDTAMSGKLEGIGARLQKKNDYITIVEIISGGPAWRSDELKVGDAILKVKQEGDEEGTSIIGMRIDDAVKLIKGPKGSKVTLTIKHVDGSIEDKTLVRDVVELEETYAKSSLIKHNDDVFGLIDLPSFYFDMQNYQERNAASDVKKEILRLKEEGMTGLVIDLRNNGGGSLRTAVDITGFFVEKGPVVQVASSGSTQVLRSQSNEIIWEGPLVILVNEISASASEILAAALQDYNRAIVIGSKQTYGKGTVQNMIDLNEWLRNSNVDDLGAVKITSQKFYRINGGSTQLEGVKSDVVIPDRYSYFDLGERDYDNPLPYDKIKPAKYKEWEGPMDLSNAIQKSKLRVKENEHIKLIDENAKWLKQQRDNNEVNLSYQAYKADMKARQNEIDSFKKMEDYNNNLEFNAHPYELQQMEQDTTLAEKRNRWYRNLKKDIYVEEAVHVLKDLLTDVKTANTNKVPK